MEDDSPVFTMVKSRVLGESPEALTEKSAGLLETLTMLCSFYSAEDLASFLFTPMFTDLTRQGDAWLGFEIGLYIDHTKTLDLFPSQENILLVDNAATGVFTENIYRCTVEHDVVAQLEKWHSVVYSAESRFE